MNLHDHFAGSEPFGTSNGFAAAFALIPSLVIDPQTGLGFVKVAGVIITSYEITQQSLSTAIALHFFDRIDVPADGTGLDDADGFLFSVIQSKSSSFIHNCIHRYLKGCVIVASTDDTRVIAANAGTLFAVTYASLHGG